MSQIDEHQSNAEKRKGIGDVIQELTKYGPSRDAVIAIWELYRGSGYREAQVIDQRLGLDWVDDEFQERRPGEVITRHGEMYPHRRGAWLLRLWHGSNSITNGVPFFRMLPNRMFGIWNQSSPNFAELFAYLNLAFKTPNAKTV